MNSTLHRTIHISPCWLAELKSRTFLPPSWNNDALPVRRNTELFLRLPEPKTCCMTSSYEHWYHPFLNRNSTSHWSSYIVKMLKRSYFQYGRLTCKFVARFAPWRLSNSSSSVLPASYSKYKKSSILSAFLILNLAPRVRCRCGSESKFLNFLQSSWSRQYDGYLNDEYSTYLY